MEVDQGEEEEILVSYTRSGRMRRYVCNSAVLLFLVPYIFGAYLIYHKSGM